MHLFKYARMALEIGSLGNFEKLPDELNSEIVRYLDTSDRVKFTLLTSKKMYEATRLLGDYETKRIADAFGLGGYMNDTEVFKEMKTFTLAVMKLLEIGDFQITTDFSEIFNFVNLYFSTLTLPKLTLIVVSGKDDLNGYSTLIRKVLTYPEEYKIVLRYLTRDHYKCDRNQLINTIRHKITAFKYFHFNNLIQYNKEYRTIIFLRKLFLFLLITASIISKLFYVLTPIESVIKLPNLMIYFDVIVLILGFKLNRYLDERYNQYL